MLTGHPPQTRDTVPWSGVMQHQLLVILTTRPLNSYWRRGTSSLIGSNQGDSMIMRALLIGAAVGALALGGAATANAEPFVNCSAAEDAGYQDIPSTSEYYGPHLDSDLDGIGCES